MPPIGESYTYDLGVNSIYDSRYYRDKYRADTGGGIASSESGDKYADVPLKDMWWDIYKNSNVQREMSVRPTLYTEVNIAPWLDFRAEADLSFYSTNRENKQLGQGAGNSGPSDQTGGYYALYKTDAREQNYAGTFTFNKRVGDFTLGGFARSQYRNSLATMSNEYTVGGLTVPGEYSIANSHNTPYELRETTSAKKVFSVAGAVNVGWRDQLYLDITGRNDWSSSLLYRTGKGNFSYFYPSVSGAWIVSETFALPKWISFGKLRASWAQVGNDAAPFVLNPTYEENKYPQADGNYIYTQTVPSALYDRHDQLRPERKNAFEIGADWRFLRGRIGIDIALYKENTRDQIMNISLPRESGVVSQVVNAGNIQNKGIEIALNTIPLKGRDWEWSMDFTYSKNQNKIISLHPNVQDQIIMNSGLGIGTFRVASVAIVGADYGLLVSDIMPERDASGNIVLQWNDYFRAAYPKRSSEVGRVGSMNPDFTGSLATGFRYKNWSLRALMDMRFGGLVVSMSNRYGTAYGVTESSLRYRDAQHGGLGWVSRWGDSDGMAFSDGVIPEGIFDAGTVINTVSDGAVDVSGMSYREAYEKGYVEPMHASSYHYLNNSWGQGTVNDGWVHKLSYVALREVSVAYRISAKFASKLGARGANIVLSGRNLGYLYNSLPNNLNPESIRGTATADFRERGFIPYTSTFMATVSIDF